MRHVIISHGNGLGMLEMRKSRHDHILLFFCLFYKNVQQILELIQRILGRLPQEQSFIDHILVISGTSRMKFLSDIANFLCQALFDGHHDILIHDVKFHFTAFQLSFHHLQPSNDLFFVRVADNILVGQHGRMSNAGFYAILS